MKQHLSTITISFKKDEVVYLQKFKSKYAVPTAIIKDFIINDVKNNNNNSPTNKSNSNISNLNNPMDLLNF